MIPLTSIKTGLGALALTVAALTGQTAPVAAQEPFLGQISAFPYTFCPRGWAAADGAIVSIGSNSALFSILGTTYGGNGTTTFGLPDLQGRSAIHTGTGPGLQPVRWGQKSGAPEVTLTESELPRHSHSVNAYQDEGDRGRPNSDFLAGGSELFYHDGPADGQMASNMLAQAGGGQPIAIMPPYIAMRWCVATVGVYPPRN